MSHTEQSPDPTDSSVRPPSGWTSSSTFADSAISMGSQTLKHQEGMSEDIQPPPSSDHSISDQLSQLAAAAWATEQELPLEGAQRNKIWKALRMIEECIDERDEMSTGAEEFEETKHSQISHALSLSRSEADPEADFEELNKVHHDLRATVESMRLRQQEHRHLNKLSLQKLESVAQTCLVQETQLNEMADDVRDLRIQNHKLGEENDNLHDRIAELEAQATQKEVAVNAMSSAVKGLEGWINSSPGPDLYGESPSRSRQKRGNYIVRGKGRFRGRYYIDDPEDEPTDLDLNGASDSRELHDGVRAWLRGFRDVEEELQKVGSDRPRTFENAKRGMGSPDEEWGDFETVSEMT